jgi:UDP-N-acetyl-D-mannosaminuronic acid dehydrogenase
MFAKNGHEVVGVDINSNIVNMVNKSTTPINEPRIETHLRSAVASKKLQAAGKPEPSDVFLICVPTPLCDKKANLSYIKSAARSIIPNIRGGNIIILESTVPPTTTKNILIPILEESGLKAGADFHVAHCPERVIPGSIFKEIVENDRIIGGLDDKSAKMAEKLYRSFVKGNIYLTDITTAEMIKLMENTYRDVNIALANDFSRICEELNIDVWEAIKLANKHPRVNIHQPGPGVGGHCIPIVPWFINEAIPGGSGMIKLCRKINNEMAQHVVDMVEELIGDISEKTITIFGVAYKGNIEDTRETPAEHVIELLLKKACKVNIFDPYVKTFKYALSDLDVSIKDSSCIVVLTDHDRFKEMNEKTIKSFANMMESKNLVDTRNCLDHQSWKKSGFNIRILGSKRVLT